MLLLDYFNAYGPDAGRKDYAMKRPLAYITAPWGADSRENQEKAAG